MHEGRQWCTLKILVMSDSHSGLSFMRSCVKAVKPDVLVHLGDYYDDGDTIAQENSNLRMHQVPGNCDLYRCVGNPSQILCYDICGVRMYLTHGHKHNVKSSLYRLLADARAMGARAVLYGHTHQADCHREEDGLWVLNPGSCGYFGGSVGLIEAEQGEIISCRILTQQDILG